MEICKVTEDSPNVGQFYVHVEQNVYYLHDDGTVHKGAIDEKSPKTSGFFETEAKAQEAIDKYHRLVEGKRYFHKIGENNGKA